MKTKLLLIAFLCATVAFGQIPSGYYSTATGTGYTLKTQLYNKIKGHTDKGYSGLWTTYATSDRDNQYENDNSIIDIYSENPTGTDPYKYTLTTNQCGTYSVEGNCYNREHIIPQSYFNNAAPMVSDAHHIPPTDGKVNGIRSNFPHGKVAVASTTTKNGSKLGTSGVSGYTGTVFEPINEFKGDIARMYFYFATRYENTVANYTSFAMLNGTSNQVFKPAFLAMLKTWHANDPVSTREIARNNAIYARQGNRNPFIDHPEYVASIWGSTAARFNNENSIELEDTSIIEFDFDLYPNPTNGEFTIGFENSKENVSIEIYSIIGQQIFQKETTTKLTVSDLQSGIYIVKITKEDKSITKRIIIN